MMIAADDGEISSKNLGKWLAFIARTTEGRARAKANGAKMGRRPKLSPAQQREARQRRAEGARSRNYNVGKSTIDRATRPAGAPSPSRYVAEISGTDSSPLADEAPRA